MRLMCLYSVNCLDIHLNWGGKLNVYIKRRFKKTMIPYYVWSLISICVFLITVRFVQFDLSEASTSLGMNVLGMLYANSRTIYMKWNLPLWFIPCMNFVMAVIFCFEKSIEDKADSMKFSCRLIAICFFAALGIFVQKCFPYKLPFQMETGVYLVSFVEIGIFIKNLKLIERSCRKKAGATVTAVILFAVSFLLISLNGFAEIREFNFGKYPVLYYIYSILISIGILIVSCMLKKNSILQEIGKNSLSILLMHKFPILFFQSVFPLTKVLLRDLDTAQGIAASIPLLSGLFG